MGRTYKATRKIRTLPSDLLLVQDSQDVEQIRQHVGKIAEPFDGFFVRVEDGDYEQVWGYEGFIPWLDKFAYRLA